MVISDLSQNLLILPSKKNFHSTKHFLFLAVAAIETGFKDLVETVQNFSKRKLRKLAHFILTVEMYINLLLL